MNERTDLGRGWRGQCGQRRGMSEYGTMGGGGIGQEVRGSMREDWSVGFVLILKEE